MKYIEEQVKRLFIFLACYGIVIVVLSLFIVAHFHRYRYVAALIVCVASLPMMLLCSYWVSDRKYKIKVLFRTQLAVISGIAVGINHSEIGMAMPAFSIKEGLFWGVNAIATVYFITMITDAIAIALFKPFRDFIISGHCSYCGYDLTGNMSGVCPECGGRIGSGRSELGRS